MPPGVSPTRPPTGASSTSTTRAKPVVESPATESSADFQHAEPAPPVEREDIDFDDRPDEPSCLEEKFTEPRVELAPRRNAQAINALAFNAWAAVVESIYIPDLVAFVLGKLETNEIRISDSAVACAADELTRLYIIQPYREQIGNPEIRSKLTANMLKPVEPLIEDFIHFCTTSFGMLAAEVNPGDLLPPHVIYGAQLKLRLMTDVISEGLSRPTITLVADRRKYVTALLAFLQRRQVRHAFGIEDGDFGAFIRTICAKNGVTCVPFLAFEFANRLSAFIRELAYPQENVTAMMVRGIELGYLRDLNAMYNPASILKSAPRPLEAVPALPSQDRSYVSASSPR